MLDFPYKLLIFVHEYLHEFFELDDENLPTNTFFHDLFPRLLLPGLPLFMSAVLLTTFCKNAISKHFSHFLLLDSSMII